MRIIKRIFSYILAVFIGYWLAMAGVLEGNKIGMLFDSIVDYLPDGNDITYLMSKSETPNLSIKNFEENINHLRKNDLETIDYELVEKTIIELVNELRLEKNLNELEKNEFLRRAAIIRATETEESFSHTRPNGEDAVTVLYDEGIIYSYQFFGENLAMGTNYMNEYDMAKLFFDGWLESEGHYENMIGSNYKETGVGIHFDGENLYATQLFGTQQ